MAVTGRRRAIAGSIATLALVMLTLVAGSGWPGGRPSGVAASSAATNAGGREEAVDPTAGSAVVPAGSAGHGDDSSAPFGGSASVADADGASEQRQGDTAAPAAGTASAGGPGNHPAPPDPGPAGPSWQEPPGDSDSAAGANSGNGGSGPSGSSGSATESATALRFVYFVEADHEFEPEATALIEQQARDLQAFWYEEFGGTFRLHDPVVEVVYGQHDANWYDQTPAGDDQRWFRLTNIRAEVRAALGIDPEGTGDVRLVTYPATRIDGRVGALRYQGALMDGDDVTCISGAVETTPYALDYPGNCLATVAHELGHVYGLGHGGEDTDCMQFGFYRYVMGSDLCHFSDQSRRLVTGDPRNAAWLDAEPGDQTG